MAFDDLVNKAKQALNSDKGEQISDKVIQGAGDLANKVTGGKHADQIARAQEAADKHIGKRDGDAATGDLQP